MLRKLVFLFIFLVYGSIVPAHAASVDPGFEQLTNGRAVSVDWSPDGQYLVYTDGSQELDVMRVADKTVVFEMNGSFMKPMWSPDGTMIAVGGAKLHVIDWATGRSILILPVESQPHYSDDPAFVTNLDWNRSSDALAIITNQGDVEIVHVPSGNTIRQNTVQYGFIYAHLLTWSPDGNLLAAQGLNIEGFASIWAVKKELNSKPGALIVDEIPTNYTDSVYDIEWNITATELAVAYGGLWIYSLDDNHFTQVDGNQDEMTQAIAWSPNGRILADSTSEDEQNFYLNFWDTTDFELISKTEPTPLFGLITDASWSPDSTQLALATESGLWIYRMQPINLNP